MIAASFEINCKDNDEIEKYLKTHGNKMKVVVQDDSKKEISQDGVFEHDEEYLYGNKQVSVY